MKQASDFVQKMQRFRSASGATIDAGVHQVKVAVRLGTDRPHVLREAIMCCRKGGTISIPGVYIGVVDKIPFGAACG